MYTIHIPKGQSNNVRSYTTDRRCFFLHLHNILKVVKMSFKIKFYIQLFVEVIIAHL